VEFGVLPESFSKKAPAGLIERAYLQLDSPDFAWERLCEFRLCDQSNTTFSKSLNIPSITVRKNLNANEQCG
jgi:hypothetical protein